MKLYFLIVFLFSFLIQSQAQNCETSLDNKYWKLRVNLSTFISQKEKIDINPTKIYYDFINMPIGVPFNYINYIDISAFEYIDLGNHNQLLLPAYQQFKLMQKKALNSGVNINIRSSYRNNKTQKIVFNKYGPSIAEKPGYSEHHLLTTIDIRYSGENTKLFLWLLTYGFDYGWVPTYYFRVEKNIRKESWHWRFVGIDAANWFQCAWKDEINAEKRRLQYTFGEI